MTDDSDEMLHLAQRGALPSDRVLSLIETSNASSTHAHDVAFIVCRAANSAIATPFFDRLLVSALDPLLARLALEALRGRFGLLREYRSYICEFISGVAWDQNQAVRQMAVMMAGSLLRMMGPDAEVVSSLLRIARDVDEYQTIREDAVAAMAHALGFDHRDLPHPSRHFDLSGPWTTQVVERFVRTYV